MRAGSGYLNSFSASDRSHRAATAGFGSPDGTVSREFGLGNIRQMVRDSPNDYVRSKKFRDLGAAWVKANWMDIPALMEQRLVRFATHNGASGLTTVPRGALFETSARAAWLDRILIDKTPAICLLDRRPRPPHDTQLSGGNGGRRSRPSSLVRSIGIDRLRAHR